ncbi:MAG: AAA family ATPase [Bacteroidetes bacterium]|nr:AAA family ATPase [Bacteroidota bacterium]MCW5895711.1 AAA family ATPase [Bacteroidota bacterium]
MRKRSSRRNTGLSYKQLRWHCAPADLGVSSIEDAAPVQEVIGQDRALRALRVGLEMAHFGYNIFVTGVSGTGRTTTIKRLLREFEHQQANLTDKCYVHNFRDPDVPRLIVLQAGQGAAFKKDISGFLTELITQIPAAFESRRYNEQRKATLEHFQERQRTVLRDLERKVKERGFEVVQVQTGPVTRPEIAPVLDGSPVTMDQFHTKVEAGDLTEEAFVRMQADQVELERQLDSVMREMRNIERKAKKSAEQLNYKVVVPIVEELVDELETKYPAGSVHEYLVDMKQHVLDNLHRFYQREEQQPPVLGITIQKEDDRFTEFQVNVVVDNSSVDGRPIILETNPRFKNLFGTIERVVDRNGVWRADFTHIKAGSLLKADGGYLVVNAIDALIEPGVWTTMKRVLRNSLLEIQPPDYGNYGSTFSALKPEPVKLNVKVVMIGDAYTYSLLYELDDDFKKIFKIRSDFDIEMPNIRKSIDSYVSFIKTVCHNEKLLPFEMSGITETVEYGARLAGQQKKLSTRFTIIADVIRESNYWAIKDQAKTVSNIHVRRAIVERIERVRLLEEKIQEMITDGSIRIDTEGAVVGQVNGLSVYELSGYAFGKPSRITAKTSMGRGGIVNIEREAKMSGPTHDKGVLILTGYMRDKYAKNKPLVLSASITFEQSYGGVDGDSASSTEVYALLSSLSEIPIRQDIAVTGSVDQHGNIQPIGGVNQKIEGFFDVCNVRGLTGTQGVLIPYNNESDLMLRHDVVDAVRRGTFHIYSIKTIDEGIEILFRKPAKTVHAKVDRQLLLYAKRVKKFG